MTALTAAEARIALLEAELETYKMYKSERDSLERAYDQATKDRNHWHDKWVATDRALGEATHPTTLPRVITADELRDGQVIAWLPPRWDTRTKWRLGAILETMGHAFRVREVDYGNPAVDGEWELYSKLVLLADAPEPRGRAGREVSPYELRVGDVVDVWHGDDSQEPYYPSATIESASPLIADQFDFEGLERSFPRFQFQLLKRPDKKPDNPWFGTVYEDGTYLADPWRGTPVRPQSIRAGDLYDIHTAHGSVITGVVAARNGVRNPQSGDHYRLVNRKA